MKQSMLRFFKSNADLVNFSKNTLGFQTVTARRAAVSIAVIDDEAFAPQTNLKSYGYNITQIGDLKNLEEVGPFHIVLCDIMGVGKHFDKVLQGASLISQIKRMYPEKIVIAYTGAMLNERAARIASERADAVIKKDVEIEAFTSKLDSLGVGAIDPYVIWNKVRARLVELDVDTRDIILFEDGYVRSVLKKDPRLSMLSDRAEKININSDVRAILQGLASSTIFSAMVGNN